VPAGIDFLFILLSCMMQPVLFMQKLLAAVGALYYAVFVSLSGVLNKLVIGRELCVAVLAFILLPMQEIHGNNHAERWL
jgi:hypothetical protein